MPGYPKCCEPTFPPIANCTVGGNVRSCTGNATPGQVLVNLPSVNQAASSRFNHAGGNFILDHYGSKPGCPFPFPLSFAVGPPIGSNLQPGVISQGAFNHYGACAYFGPEIGYDCGNVVRPAAIYQWYPSLITAGSWIGYFKPETSIVLCDSSIGIWTPVLYGLSTFGYPLAWRVGISDFDLDCVNHTYTEIYAGDSGVNGVDCSGSGAASFTVGATTLALGPA